MAFTVLKKPKDDPPKSPSLIKAAQSLGFNPYGDPAQTPLLQEIKQRASKLETLLFLEMLTFYGVDQEILDQFRTFFFGSPEKCSEVEIIDDSLERRKLFDLINSKEHSYENVKGIMKVIQKTTTIPLIQLKMHLTALFNWGLISKPEMLECLICNAARRKDTVAFTMFVEELIGYDLSNNVEGTIVPSGYTHLLLIKLLKLTLDLEISCYFSFVTSHPSYIKHYLQSSRGYEINYALSSIHFN